MTTDDLSLQPRERAFIERMAHVYAPHPLSRAEQRAFDQRLDDRRQREGPGTRWLPVGAAVAVASVALLLWVVFPAEAPRVGPPGPIALEDVPVDYAGVYAETSLDVMDEEALPDDYVAIASVFLGH